MLIRAVKTDDANQISNIARDILNSNRELNMLKIDFSDATKLIESLTPLDHMFVMESATAPQEIRAIVLLSVNSQIYLRRSATLELIVDTKWQRQGIGKALMTSALEMAYNELMMERIEVEVAVDNDEALKLCKSAGFKVEGVAKDWAIASDGKYVDAYLMARCKS